MHRRTVCSRKLYKRLQADRYVYWHKLLARRYIDKQHRWNYRCKQADTITLGLMQHTLAGVAYQGVPAKKNWYCYVGESGTQWNALICRSVVAKLMLHDFHKCDSCAIGNTQQNQLVNKTDCLLQNHISPK